MSTNGQTLEKPKGGNRAPRAKGGKFGTSEAAKRRKAKGMEAAPNVAAMTAGFAANLAIEEPAIPAPIRQEMAQVSAKAVSMGKGLAMGLIDKVRQSLAKNEGIREIVNAVPDAARYIASLVRGEEEGAPHAIRLQAALAVFDISGARLAPSADERDLSELTISELEQRLNGLALAGESSTIHAESPPNPVNVAPLSPSNARPELE